jgi:Asp-tRNA(Asn)/Glu-tRNA(Gln) amidotransferase A subunit family amidase
LIPGVAYVQAQRLRRLIRHDVSHLFQHADCLLMPAAPGPAPHGLGTTGDPSFNVLASLSGFPGITIPSGLNAVGLPLAVQLLGPALADAPLLAAARWCEAALDIALVPPLGA